jgi:hypothetical protein
MTRTMLYVDRGRTRMPLICTVISVLVWTVCATIFFVSCWLSITSAPDESPSKRSDSYAMEAQGRPGRRFSIPTPAL